MQAAADLPRAAARAIATKTPWLERSAGFTRPSWHLQSWTNREAVEMATLTWMRCTPPASVQLNRICSCER